LKPTYQNIGLGILILTITTLFSCKPSSQVTSGLAAISSPIYLTPPSPNDSTLIKLDSLDIDFQMRGFFYAISSRANSIPSNGEWQSDNTPKKWREEISTPRLSLFIDINRQDTFLNRFFAHKLYLINHARKVCKFTAQDSRLDIIAEVLDSSGVWRIIMYLPSSWCGNSYHTVVLDKNEYWEFDIPVFKGSYSTKLRYQLSYDSTTIYSNAINARINPEQMNPERKVGHVPQSIMAPYSE